MVSRASGTNLPVGWVPVIDQLTSQIQLRRNENNFRLNEGALGYSWRNDSTGFARAALMD